MGVCVRWVGGVGGWGGGHSVYVIRYIYMCIKLYILIFSPAIYTVIHVHCTVIHLVSWEHQYVCRRAFKPLLLSELL